MGRKQFMHISELRALRAQSPTFPEFVENFKKWAIAKYQREHGYDPSELAIEYLLSAITNEEAVRALYP